MLDKPGSIQVSLLRQDAQRSKEKNTSGETRATRKCITPVTGFGGHLLEWYD